MYISDISKIFQRVKTCVVLDIKKIYVPNQAVEAGPGSPPAKKERGRPRKNLAQTPAVPTSSVITVTPAASDSVSAELDFLL